MDHKGLYLLFRVVKGDSNLNILLREGMDFRQIGELIEEAAKIGLIETKNSKIILTELGLTKFEEYRLEYKKRNKEEWIEKEKDSQIPKLDKDFIYLPDPNNLSL